MSFTDRVAQAMEWLQKRARPRFLSLYFEIVDSVRFVVDVRARAHVADVQNSQMGHEHGPESRQVNEAIQIVDDTIGTTCS